MRNKIMEVSRRSFNTGFGAVLAIGMLACSSSDRGEPEAARAASLARDVEGNIERLDEAIEAYRKIATEYETTPSGKKAAERVNQLASITGMIDGFQSAQEDSLPSVAGAILRRAPNYEPVLHRLGNHYANRSKLWTRAASTWKNAGMGDQLLRVWSFQDSLWSAYPFRPTHEDRAMRDVLCQHAINVGRMMEGLKRYDEALKVIERGIAYGSSKDGLAEAKVFGSFYRFRTGDSDGAFTMAGEALENGDLKNRLKGRAHHVRGLVSIYRYQDNNQVDDLDEAIKSLNEAVVLDPAVGDARALLKELRKARASLQAS